MIFVRFVLISSSLQFQGKHLARLKKPSAAVGGISVRRDEKESILIGTRKGKKMQKKETLQQTRTESAQSESSLKAGRKVELSNCLSILFYALINTIHHTLFRSCHKS